MKFQRGMFAESWHILRRIMLYAALVIVVEYLILKIFAFFRIGSDYLVVVACIRFLLWSFLAYVAHTEILLPRERDRAEDYLRFFGFALRSFGLAFIVFLPVGVLFIVIYTAFQNRGDSHLQSLILLVLVPTILILLPLTFCLLGTILPAYVVGRGRGIRAALSRGRRQLLWTLGRFVAALGVVFLFSNVIVSGGLFVIQLISDVVFGRDLPYPVLLFAALVKSAAQAYAVALVAVILSRAYLRDSVASS